VGSIGTATRSQAQQLLPADRQEIADEEAAAAAGESNGNEEEQDEEEPDRKKDLMIARAEMLEHIQYCRHFWSHSIIY